MEIQLNKFEEEYRKHYQDIFNALIKSGGLTGVKGGKTIIHFDENGIFQKIQLDYFPWRRKFD